MASSGHMAFVFYIGRIEVASFSSFFIFSFLPLLGFNPPETKIRTPDGKVWQEAELHNLSAQLHGTLPASFQGEF